MLKKQLIYISSRHFIFSFLHVGFNNFFFLEINKYTENEQKLIFSDYICVKL
jgi:hypothetical protein